MFNVKESNRYKAVRSESYNYDFDKQTGMFARWGKDANDDPQVSPFGPEILDIEVTTSCQGVANNLGIRTPCKFCYKSNTPNGKNMSLDNFKVILDKLSKNKILTQIAIGADAQAIANPDLFAMMEYTRSLGIVPNITVADITDDVADKLSKLCGAVAVSRYTNKNICYDTIKKLTDRGMKQINIHIMLSDETYDQVIETINDYHSDPRLAKMNAVVLLSLKKKGRGEGFHSLTQDQFNNIVNLSMANKIKFGFDSCGANKFLKAIEGKEELNFLKQYVEPCESTLFSSYVNVDGHFVPCSFCENTEFGEGIDVLTCNNFLEDIWNHAKVEIFREKLLSCGRNCPIYEI